jgi:ribosome-binding protein aMBF1 (putative translation factor)
MNDTTEYKQAIAQAREHLADIRERDTDAIGENALKFMEKLLSPEEIAASRLRVAMMTEIAHTRSEKGISQKKLEAMSGVKQPVIARMEKGCTSPQLDTVLKVLAPLGKTLYIGDLQSE